MAKNTQYEYPNNTGAIAFNLSIINIGDRNIKIRKYWAIPDITNFMFYILNETCNDPFTLCFPMLEIPSDSIDLARKDSIDTEIRIPDRFEMYYWKYGVKSSVDFTWNVTGTYTIQFEVDHWIEQPVYSNIVEFKIIE